MVVEEDKDILVMEPLVVLVVVLPVEQQVLLVDVEVQEIHLQLQ